MKDIVNQLFYINYAHPFEEPLTNKIITATFLENNKPFVDNIKRIIINQTIFILFIIYPKGDGVYWKDQGWPKGRISEYFYWTIQETNKKNNKD